MDDPRRIFHQLLWNGSCLRYDSLTETWRQLWIASNYSIDIEGGLNQSGAMVLEGQLHNYRSSHSFEFRGTMANRRGVRAFQPTSEDGASARVRQPTVVRAWSPTAIRRSTDGILWNLPARIPPRSLSTHRYWRVTHQARALRSRSTSLARSGIGHRLDGPVFE